jgi:uncharacterized protein YwqG
MLRRDVADVLAPFIERHRKTAYRPVVSEGQGAPDGSRFNGAPFLMNGEAWPECSFCAKPMAMFLQLNLSTLPAGAGAFGSGLLQLFYCVEDHDYTQTEDWAAFDHKVKLARVIPDGTPGAIAMPKDVGLKANPLAIVGWTPFEETPNTEEAADYGLQTIYDRTTPREVRTKFVSEPLGIDTGWLDSNELNQVFEKLLAPAFKDKLSGWPGWVQGVEYPSCTACGARMQLVFQIDSEDHVPWMFGDMGCGHITQCPEHKSVVTFAWACH